MFGVWGNDGNCSIAGKAKYCNENEKTTGDRRINTMSNLSYENQLNWWVKLDLIVSYGECNKSFTCINNANACHNNVGYLSYVYVRVCMWITTTKKQLNEPPNDLTDRTIKWTQSRCDLLFKTRSRPPAKHQQFQHTPPEQQQQWIKTHFSHSSQLYALCCERLGSIRCEQRIINVVCSKSIYLGKCQIWVKFILACVRSLFSSSGK